MKGGSNRLISAAEAAEILGVSRDYVYKNWRQLGLKAKRVGRSLKFLERDIENWIERNSA